MAQLRPSMSCPAGCSRSCSSPFAIGLEPMAPRWLTIVAKFGDHLPFYRQAEIFKRQGIDLDWGTLGKWVGRACCFHLMPVINQMRAHLRRADRIFVPSCLMNEVASVRDWSHCPARHL